MATARGCHARRLRIGYVMQADSVPMDVTSGPQLHVQAVVRGLAARGHDVRLLAIQHGCAQWTDDLAFWRPAPLSPTLTGPARWVERAVRGVQSRLQLPFLRAFDSYRFSDAGVRTFGGRDILYERAGVLSYGGLITARRLRIPLVLELNGDLLEEYVQAGVRLSAAQWLVLRRLTRWLYARADAIVAVSDTLARSTVERWSLDASKVVAVPNGADLDRFLAPVDVASVRARHRLPDGPLVVLVCSFEPWHGVDLLLDAFARLARRGSRASLVLVGEGRTRPAMTQRACELGLAPRVRFTGLVGHSEVAGLLGAAEVAVVSQRGSAAEAALSPLKLFEYMAAAKAIVAPDVATIAAILEHERTGLLFERGDVDALARAIGRLLDDGPLRLALGAAARRQAIEHHSWDSTVQAIEHVLERVLRPGEA